MCKSKYEMYYQVCVYCAFLLVSSAAWPEQHKVESSPNNLKFSDCKWLLAQENRKNKGLLNEVRGSFTICQKVWISDDLESDVLNFLFSIIYLLISLEKSYNLHYISLWNKDSNTLYHKEMFKINTQYSYHCKFR